MSCYRVTRVSVGCVLALVCVLVTRSIFSFDVQEELSANEQPPRWPDPLPLIPYSLRSSLDPPSRKPRNLSGRFANFEAQPFYNSQLDQDEWVDRVFGYATGLFVLESGANNGVAHSNSLFLEIGRQWRCLLVEANPELAPVIRALHRKCHFLSGGLSITDGVSSFPFMLAGPLGGIVSEMNKLERAHSEINENKPWMAGPQGNGSTVQVTCFPLHLVMQALGVNTIDYWSLDTEGSELAILRATDFTQVEVGVLTVEHGGHTDRRQAVQEHLEEHGFERVKSTFQDDYFASRSYFGRRGLTFPSGS